MGLSEYSYKGSNYPVLTCDTCDKPIKDIRLAIIAFNNLFGNPILHAAGIYHKGKCDPGNKVFDYSDELVQYTRKLIVNQRLGKIVVNGSKRQLIIDIPEPDNLTEVIGKLPW